MKQWKMGGIWRAWMSGSLGNNNGSHHPLKETAILETLKAPQGFAYLFEEFPSFTQTFCFREVNELLNQGVEFPIFSMWKPKHKLLHNFPTQLTERISYFPDNIRQWARRSRKEDQDRIEALRIRLAQEWKKDKKRAEEVSWIAPILEKLGVGHVHIHFAGVAVSTAYWLKKTIGIRYSFTAHANDFWVNPEEKCLEDLIREAEFVATVTDFSANWLKERFPQYGDRIHRVYNGISINRFIRKQIPTNPPRILSVARYIEKKGFFDLIQACELLKEENFQCLIVGHGPLEKELKKQVRKVGLESKVIIAGPRSENEIADLLSGTSIFVLACKTARDGGMDNLPTVIMEAMAASVPVISTRIAGIPEMVSQGTTGYLVQEGDPVALASAIKTLLKNPESAKRMGEQGRISAQNKFDISVTVDSLKSLLTRYGALR